MSASTPDTALDIEVLKQFRIIIKSIRGHFQSIEASCGISGAQLWALAKIDSTSDITISELAKELAIHQTTASNLVEKLCAKKLIKRVRQHTDQRFVSLMQTAAGKKMLAQAPTPLQGLLPDALGRMPYKKLLMLHELLGDLQNLMASIDESAAAAPLSDDDTEAVDMTQKRATKRK
ncbi:MAG TPA: MarR family winged helix-turn-helix transcriptional regulator [Spongiibacteraceae bacterium]